MLSKMKVVVPKEIVAFVERELEFDHSGHGLQHAERVFRNACAIMEEEGRGDFLIVAASAFLHDCIDHKLFEDFFDFFLIIASISILFNFFSSDIEFFFFIALYFSKVIVVFILHSS